MAESAKMTLTLNGKKLDDVWDWLAVPHFKYLSGENFESETDKAKFFDESERTYSEFIAWQEQKYGVKLEGVLRLWSGDFKGDSGSQIMSASIPRVFEEDTISRQIAFIVTNQAIDNYIRSAAKETPDQDWTVIDIHQAIFETLCLDLDLDDTSLFKELLTFFNGRQVYHKYAN